MAAAVRELRPLEVVGVYEARVEGLEVPTGSNFFLTLLCSLFPSFLLSWAVCVSELVHASSRQVDEDESEPSPTAV